MSFICASTEEGRGKCSNGSKRLCEGVLCMCMYLLQALQVKQLSW